MSREHYLMRRAVVKGLARSLVDEDEMDGMAKLPWSDLGKVGFLGEEVSSQRRAHLGLGALIIRGTRPV